MKTQVAIIGSGPAGMLLAHYLAKHGIESIVLERQSQEHVLARIRAGVLEATTVELLRELGLHERMEREGHPHDGVRIAFAGRASFFVDTWKSVGKRFMVYGQTEIQRDLYAAAQARGQQLFDRVEEVRLHDFADPVQGRPYVSFRRDGVEERIDCDFIAGCDGFHGVSRRSIPASVAREYEKVYPFGWLGVLAHVPPLPDVTYVNSPRGFALASYRNPTLSRYYIQVPLEDKVEDWPDERFWPELIARFPEEFAARIVPGAAIEKSIAPLRSYVHEPMQYGRLFLCGDAAHIVPPTGAKGLNLAASDVAYLGRALVRHYRDGRSDALLTYSETALRRVWSSVRTSWYLTNLLHRFPHFTPFDQKAQEVELDFLMRSPHALAALAEQYAGTALEPLRQE
ncbi:MAG: 4-hydroxybenzoate 3-monooxygenase [Casimicrobiaceae bacterium]|nr:4-hydroxybenzoate 3-monooxygenase [Casimicrobiaceae bacterium]MDW8313121.1 4-hydroxybenzoate 3-monooxygenase [Burkholderiales bacterium]